MSVPPLAFDPESDTIAVGKIYAPGHGPCIGVVLGARLYCLDPNAAREVALMFEAASADGAALEDVAAHLRRAADEIDALQGSIQ